jgi:CheY-like chemotaxis protein
MAGQVKRVLIVDDETLPRGELRAAFSEHAETHRLFEFQLEEQESVEEAIESIRATSTPPAKGFDVLVLDLSFDPPGLDRKGLRLASALGLFRRLGEAIPIVIVFSAYADLHNSVQAMRSSAWDVIHKWEPPEAEGMSPYQLVVESAVLRLRALDLESHLRSKALAWLQHHIADLQVSHGGQVVAIWHEPEVHVVASGKDPFELELQLETWRENRPEWMYPFVISIPEKPVAAFATGGWQ